MKLSFLLGSFSANSNISSNLTKQQQLSTRKYNC